MTGDSPNDREIEKEEINHPQSKNITDMIIVPSEGVAGAVLIQQPENTQWAYKVAQKTFDEEKNAVYGMHPYMSSENFAFMP